MSVLSRLGVAARLLPPFPKPFSRNYGSAAAAQLDYDSYYCYDDDDDKSEKTNQREIEDSDGWETLGRGVQWVIMGDPMARRHLYAQRLANLLQVPHISMGSLVRQELNPDSPLYKKIASAVNQGKLVPEDVIFGLLSKRLEEGYCRGETGFILDGIPRTRMQAEILDQIADIDLVLNLKCAEESVVKKTLGGGMYSPSREFHSLATSGFNLGIQKQPGPFQSTNADSPFQSTNADSDTVWKEKLRMYAEQMKPLEEYYKQQHKLLDYQVVGAPGDTWQGLLAALQLQHVNVVTSPANTSQKLTA